MHREYPVAAPAGFGKTHVIQNVLRTAWERVHGKNGVWVTASTGLAALALEGVTIHSAAGLKRGNRGCKRSGARDENDSEAQGGGR